MPRWLFLEATVFSAILTGAGPVVAETSDVDSLLAAAEEQFLDVEYESALETLERADGTGGLSHGQTTRLLALRGTIHLLMGGVTEAHEAYSQLLAADPTYVLPEEYPPRAAEFLESIRGEIAVPVSLVHTPLHDIAVGQPVTIEVQVPGAPSQFDVRIFFRGGGERGYSSTEMSRIASDRFVGTIPGSLGSEGTSTIEYFIVVSDGDRRVAHSGSPSRPHSVLVAGGGSQPEPRPRGQPIVRRWWFWTALGGGVALALGLGLGIGLGGSSDAETGTVDLTLRFPQDQ